MAPFVGRVITKEGIVVDPSKKEAVANWPKPNNVSKVRSFLGLAGYYRKFIQGFFKDCYLTYIINPKKYPTQMDEC